MRTIARWSCGFAALFAWLLPDIPAEAAPRTWVASNGTDAGACTRAAPCATFAFAFGVTDAGGEINCVDSGQYGGVSFSKSVTIDCGGHLSGSGGLVTQFDATGPGAVVRLRNLTINGVGGASVGVGSVGAAALWIENCIITGYGSGVGAAIRLAPPVGVDATLVVQDSIISNNGLAAGGGGIVIQPGGTGSARVLIERTRIEGNTHGIVADGTTTTGSIVVQVRDSVVAGSTGNGIWTKRGGVVVDRTSVTNNAGYGIFAD